MIIFCHLSVSSPCRLVQMTAAALNVKLNLIEVDPYRKEHLTPKFLKLNPHHTVPVLVDGDFVLYESRPICIYLIEKYGKDDSLYPRDAKKRALVNQRLYFDMATLFQRFAEFYYPQVLSKLPGDKDKLKSFNEAMQWLEMFLKNQTFVAHTPKMTIADISVAATISTCENGGYDLSNFPNIHRWYVLMKKTCPGWSVNLKAAAMMKHYTTKISYDL
jgi:glutathione S-transferase